MFLRTSAEGVTPRLPDQRSVQGPSRQRNCDTHSRRRTGRIQLPMLSGPVLLQIRMGSGKRQAPRCGQAASRDTLSTVALVIRAAAWRGSGCSTDFQQQPGAVTWTRKPAHAFTPWHAGKRSPVALIVARPCAATAQLYRRSPRPTAFFLVFPCARPSRFSSPMPAPNVNREFPFTRHSRREPSPCWTRPDPCQ